MNKTKRKATGTHYSSNLSKICQACGIDNVFKRQIVFELGLSIDPTVGICTKCTYAKIKEDFYTDILSAKYSSQVYSDKWPRVELKKQSSFNGDGNEFTDVPNLKSDKYFWTDTFLDLNRIDNCDALSLAYLYS